MTPIEQLLDLVARFGEAMRISEATVSSRFLGGGAVVRELREGRDMGARRIARAIEAFSLAWPEGAVWPEGVERPVPTPAAAE